MNYCKVVAILNLTDYRLISQVIDKLDLPGVTISMVKGFGDYINQFKVDDGVSSRIITSFGFTNCYNARTDPIIPYVLTPKSTR